MACQPDEYKPSMDNTQHTGGFDLQPRGHAVRRDFPRFPPPFASLLPFTFLLSFFYVPSLSALYQLVVAELAAAEVAVSVVMSGVSPPSSVRFLCLCLPGVPRF